MLLATVELAVPGTNQRIPCRVWMVGGIVFSFEFGADVHRVNQSDLQVVSVEVATVPEIDDRSPDAGASSS